MTVDAVPQGDGPAAQEAALRADAEVLTGAERRLLAQAAALEGRPGVPDWCVPTLRRQAECCRAAARDLSRAAAVLGRHAARVVDGRPTAV
ncbi:hypothetical protein [Streptomyces ficellus]|uniref:Uncharacterized protein n=1 Tax=Streptomyces ficellus TaxID=1977088 RepID=A0A6I6FAL3_9ACTN|nr:hypothetical protein [Streptomyces ficellus]QGV77222.1 hypothetical protein EIZ62_02360 [Streptomyces ficellus]